MKSKQTTTIEQAAALLKSRKSIALFAHKNPDGDTIGACIALKTALQKYGKTAEIFCDPEMGATFSKFSQTSCIRDRFVGKYDLYVAVDCSDLARLGSFAGVYDAALQTLTIDHHGGEYFSAYNCLKDYASCCQIVYEIIKLLNCEIDKTIATYLYMGLCTDTGNFCNSNTDSDSFYMAGDLFALGADVQKISRVFFRESTLAKTKLTAKAVARMREYYDSQMFLVYVTKDDLDEFGLDHTSTTGIVSYAIDIDTARVGVCMTEYAPNVYKISMRGRDFCVRDVCKEFGGGGHDLAAGCMISGFLEDVIEKIVRAVGFSI